VHLMSTVAWAKILARSHDAHIYALRTSEKVT
jgi:hypothetical protein